MTNVFSFVCPLLPSISPLKLDSQPFFRRYIATAKRSGSRPPNSKRPWNLNDNLLKRLESIPDALSPDGTPNLANQKESNFSSTHTQLISIVTYLHRDLSPSIDKYLSKPLHLLSSSALAILFGFFCATAAATIIGSVADWDPLAAAVLLIWIETYSKYYYTKTRRSRFLQIINAFKIGLIYGMTIDALKLST